MHTTHTLDFFPPKRNLPLLTVQAIAFQGKTGETPFKVSFVTLPVGNENARPNTSSLGTPFTWASLP